MNLLAVFFKYVLFFNILFSGCIRFVPVSNEKIIDRDLQLDDGVETTVDTFSISGIDFVLKDSATLSKIEIAGDNNELIGELELKSSAFIIRKEKSKELLFYSYPEFNIDRIYMLAGTELDSIGKIERGISIDNSCGSMIQGLIVNQNKFYLTKAQKGFSKCKGFSSDEKDFYALAESFNTK